MTQTEARELAHRFGVRMCDENGNTHGEELYCFGLDDIIAIKEALAKPEHEPVAKVDTWSDNGQVQWFKPVEQGILLYAQSVNALKPLTEAEIFKALESDIEQMELVKQDPEEYAVIIGMARAIEKAHGIGDKA